MVGANSFHTNGYWFVFLWEINCFLKPWFLETLNEGLKSHIKFSQGFKTRGSSLRIELRLSCKFDCRAKLSRSGRRKWIQRINFPSTYIFGKRFTNFSTIFRLFLEIKNMQLSFYAFPSITFRNTHSNHFPKNLFSEITVLLWEKL